MNSNEWWSCCRKKNGNIEEAMINTNNQVWGIWVRQWQWQIFTVFDVSEGFCDSDQLIRRLFTAHTCDSCETLDCTEKTDAEKWKRMLCYFARRCLGLKHTTDRSRNENRMHKNLQFVSSVYTRNKQLFEISHLENYDWIILFLRAARRARYGINGR